MGSYQRSGKNHAGRRLPQREIAASAGVSISTVSRVLNNASTMSADIRERVLVAASNLGYPLEPRKLENITLFTGPIVTSAVAGQFEAGIIAGIDAECRSHDIQLVHMNIEPGPDAARFVMDIVKQNKQSGFIFLSPDDHTLIEEVSVSSQRVVLINFDDEALAIDTVVPGSKAGARIAMRHLIQNGHKNILHIASNLRSTVRNRHVSYRATLEEAGIAYNPALVLIMDGSLQADAGYERMKAFLAGVHPSFSAVFCVNDGIAIGVMRALQEAGLHIPQDVSIIGFDDIDFVAFMNPPLTTMRIERAEMGKLAVRRLLERIEEPYLAPIRIEVGCRLIERQSVAAIK